MRFWIGWRPVLAASLLAGPAATLWAQHVHPPQPGRAVGPDSASPRAAAAVSRRFLQHGVSVELSLAPLGAGQASRDGIVAGRDVEVRLTFADSATGAPKPALAVAAWIDSRGGPGPTGTEACRDKVQSYLRGTLQFRPTIDLNSHFVAALNVGNTISVIDPLLGFSVSNLYTAVALRAEGDDWALAPDVQRLFVSLPRINAVAVVSTSTWKVETNLAVGARPTRIALQPDGRLLWVADGVRGEAGGVTVVDPATLTVVRHIATGAGSHDIAFSDDSRLVFVTNRDEGSVTVLDARDFGVVQTVATGEGPTGVAYSRVAAAAYVVHDGGTVAVIDRERLAVSHVPAKPGLRAIRFDPSERWGFAVNPAENEVAILDAASGRLRHTVKAGQAPDQVTFTENFAYVRSTGTPEVTMISLGGLTQVDSVRLVTFSAGAAALGAADAPGNATAIAPASHHGVADAVYVPNPRDRSVYGYHYMMGAPMPSGRFNTYPFEPRAVLVVSRSLRETEPGVYTTTIRAPAGGPYDIVLLVSEPRIVHCFDFDVAPDARAEATGEVRVQLRHPADRPIAVADTVALRFELVDVGTGRPQVGLRDVEVLLASPTGWSVRRRGVHLGDGLYEAEVAVPAPGVYYLSIASRALRIRFQDQLPVVVQAATGERGSHDRR